MGISSKSLFFVVVAKRFASHSLDQSALKYSGFLTEPDCEIDD